MEKFKCSVCGKMHDFYGSSAIVSFPDAMEKLRMENKNKFLKLHDYFYHYEDFFIIIKGNLFVEVIDQDWFMHWEVWAKIKEDDYYLSAQDLDLTPSFKVEAKLIYPVLHYNMPLNEPILLEFDFQDENYYPEVVPLNEKSELFTDFYNGVCIDKLKQWMITIYHPE